MDIIELPMNLVDEDTDQPRYQFDEEALQELMNSIEELGLLSPIKVRTTPDGRYKIIYGNRRYKASKMLGRPTIPCIVSTVTDEMEIYLEQIAENLTREGFSPIEEAEAFHKLLNDTKFSSSTKFLSSKLGKPEAYIKNKIELLKFSNAVKKLIISGTEIKKDKLTEDQLLPLKDLPIEYRDPLALIVARDEMPVSDAKKISQLFKDKDISAATKDKLLYKSGNDLLETWSIYRQNRAERAKPVEPKAVPVKNEKAVKETVSQPSETAAEPNAATSMPPVSSLTPIEIHLERLLSTLPAPHSLTHEIIRSQENILPGDREAFFNDIDKVIDNLEKHLLEWKSIKEQAKLSTQPAEVPNN